MDGRKLKTESGRSVTNAPSLTKHSTGSLLEYEMTRISLCSDCNQNDESYQQNGPHGIKLFSHLPSWSWMERSRPIGLPMLVDQKPHDEG